MRASRYPQQFSIVLVEPDSDYVGQGALVELARVLRTNCRSIDLVARFPGQRFGILLPHTGREASVLSERICRTAAGKVVDEQQPLNVSSGFAVFPTNGRSTDELLAAAAGALLEAKRQGGSRSLRAEPIARGNGEPQTAAG
jgi:diguanylate cyclase (GGDEF)-like protein